MSDILACSGGKSESILDYRVGPARFQQAQDQEVTDKSVRALLKSYTDRRPLVLLVDENYALFPFDLGASGYTYVVLGFYWISHAWGMTCPIRIHVCQSLTSHCSRISIRIQWFREGCPLEIRLSMVRARQSMVDSAQERGYLSRCT